MGKPSFPIVGLGASAGGLEALQTFFENVPEDCGIAFVVITHTLPDRKSLLPELLAAHSRMPVVVIEDPLPVEPGHIYLAPPGERIEIKDGVLQRLLEQKHQRLPIDLFFRSLASDKKEQAIGIVLSGTGSDGTLGLEEIKGAGGMVMAQDQTEMVDYVLPAADLPEQLIAYAETAFGKDGFAKPEAPIDDEGLGRLFLMLRSLTGHDFSGYKRTTIVRRVERRMHVHQLRTIEDYLTLLGNNHAEIELLFNELLIGVTSFFRDADAFEVLGSQIIPEMLAAKQDDHLVRVWVLGCSTGEEAYSLAMMIREAMDEELQTVNAELEGKVEELSRTTDDMRNLLNGTDVATIFLDSALCIKRYTERAKKMISLIPSDIGGRSPIWSPASTTTG